MLWLALTASLAATEIERPAVEPEPMPAAIVDLRPLDDDRIERLKGALGPGWWIEVGDALLVAAPAEVLRTALAGQSVRRTLEPLSWRDLRLHGQGCDGDANPPAGQVLLAFDRQVLLRAPPSFVPYAKTGDRWQTVAPNTVLYSDPAHRPGVKALSSDPLLAAMVASVDPARWFADVTRLAGWNRSSFGTEIQTARDWLAFEFQRLGLMVSRPPFGFTASGISVQSENVVGRLVGHTRPEEWVIVGGHIDSRNEVATATTQTPGAEDNASGCAGVLEMARVLTRFRPERTVLFVCYSGEEQGLHGARAHVQQLEASGDLKRVQLMLNMDMIGYSADAEIDESLGSRTAHGAVVDRILALSATYVPELVVRLNWSTCCSDHVPFLDRNIPAVHAFQGDFAQYVHYHRTTDRPENITNALAMGGAILRRNAAVLGDFARATERAFLDGFEGP